MSERRRFRFSLKTFLLFVLLCGIALMPLVWKLEKARKQREAVAEIQRLGGIVFYDWRCGDDGGPRNNAKEPRRTWLRQNLGTDFFDDVHWADLRRTEITDADLVHVKAFTDLRQLWLARTQITGAGFENLNGLTKLNQLWLSHTQITDAALLHVNGLTELETLDLDDTQITDAGLVHLTGLTNLEDLWLRYTQITDAGLEHLKGLKNLKKLHLSYTPVTDVAVADLKKALPNCRIEWRPPE